MTAPGQDKNLILRIKEDMDNVEPAASSVAALNLLRLAQHTERNDFQEIAGKTLSAFGANMKEAPRSLPQMLVALDFALTEPRQIVIAGAPEARDTQEMRRVLPQHFIPVKTMTLAGPSSPYKSLEAKATAYVCVRHACQQPTTDPATFDGLLKTL